MEQQCHYCKQIKECISRGKYYVCDDHKHLKQYQFKEKTVKALKRTPLKRTPLKKKLNSTPIGKTSKREARNIKNKHKAYDLLAESIPKNCTGCGNAHNISHSHLVPVGQNKSLEAVVSNITYHCLIGMRGIKGCHDIWEHDNVGRKELLDYEENMHRIQILDPEYYNLIKGKES